MIAVTQGSPIALGTKYYFVSIKQRYVGGNNILMLLHHQPLEVLARIFSSFAYDFEVGNLRICFYYDDCATTRVIFSIISFLHQAAGDDVV